MKKLILTAAFISVNTLAFGQFGSDNNVFNNNSRINNTETITQSQPTSSTYNSKVTVSTTNQKTAECVAAEAKWDKFKGNPENSTPYQRARQGVIDHCGYDPATQTGPTVPVDMVAFPLLASALALVVAFRKRIAGRLS